MKQPFILVFCLTFCELIFAQRLGQTCVIRGTATKGKCTLAFSCPIQNSVVPRQRCGFAGYQQTICCPDSIHRSAKPRKPKVNKTPSISERKCKEYTEAVFSSVSTYPFDGERPITTKIDKCGHQVVPLIVGGEEARPREFPHMALVGFEDGDRVFWSCSGTLISTQYVLTAAHCLWTSNWGNAKFVRLGQSDLKSPGDDEQAETFLVSQTIAHPRYKRPQKYNDIGLLQLHRTINLNPYIRPACLPTDYEPRQGVVTATGWGLSESQMLANRMLKVKLTLENPQECNATYARKTILPDGIRAGTQICAGTSNDNKNTCTGDGGGPLQVYHPQLYCMYTVIGITSFGIPCGGEANAAGVYTRVYPYVRWIEKIVWQNT